MNLPTPRRGMRFWSRCWLNKTLDGPCEQVVTAVRHGVVYYRGADGALGEKCDIEDFYRRAVKPGTLPWVEQREFTMAGGWDHACRELGYWVSAAGEHNDRRACADREGQYEVGRWDSAHHHGWLRIPA